MKSYKEFIEESKIEEVEPSEETIQEAERVGRSDYRLSPSGRKVHRQISFKDAKGGEEEDDDKEDDKKKEVKEEKMTDAEMKERERIVKGMKKNLAGFKDKYGDRAKSVMYATATKLAKEEVELEESMTDSWKKVQSMDKGSVTGDKEQVKKRLAYLNAVHDHHKKFGNDTKKVKGEIEAINRSRIAEENAPVAPSIAVHRIGVTVSEPDHPAVSQRKEMKQKFVRVMAQDKDKAVEQAKKHFSKKGYKVHGAEHAGMVHEETEQVNELSTDLLARYKKAATVDHKAAGEQGDIKRGDKRFSGTLKATRKQFDNDLKNEEINLSEATVETKKYSWGTMKTVHHGSSFSIPLHPEHHQAIAKLKDEQEHKFKDETGRHWTARRKGDEVHFHGANGGDKTKVAHSTMKEEVEQIDERNKENALKRKTMDASRGARWKVQNKVSADDVRDWDGKHPTNQAQNKAIGRALRNEEEEETTMQKTYKEFMEQILEYNAKDGVYRHSGSYGSSYDGKDEKKSGEPAEKRGRGRPAGSKSGANQKVTTKRKTDGADYTGYKLHLPGNK